MFKKMLALLLAVIMCLAVSVSFIACGDDKPTPDDDPKTQKDPSVAPLAAVALGEKFTVPADFKIGFILLHDENSTYDLNFINAIKTIQAHLGLTNDQIIIKTNVPEEGNDCYNAAKELVEKNCKIVFADSFGHEANMIKAAREFKDVQFCHATGTKALTENLPNYHNAFASIYEGRFLAGVAAGMKLNEMISSGKITADQAVIGYVGAYPYAEVVSGYTSFFLGARMICPSATMKVRYTSSWYSEASEAEAATSLINIDKCVLISQHADSMGAPNTCEKAGVPNVSYNGSTVEACPETFIISSAINWAPYYYYIIDGVVNNKTIDANWCGSIKTGSVILSVLNGDAAAPGTLAKIQEIAAKLSDGTLHVFDTNSFTVNGKKLDSYLADVKDFGDYVGETEVIKDGYFHESTGRSAPYFDLRIDGITEINK